MSPFSQASGLHLRLCALTACAVLWSQPAFAVLASFDYPLKATDLAGGALGGANSITLPNSGSPGFVMNFVLPRDYTNNTAVKIIVYLTPSNLTPCQIRLVPAQLQRKRVGAGAVNNLAGLSSTSTQVNFDGSGVVVQKVFTLVAGGPLPSQLKGDAFAVQFARQANDASDTCATSVFVQAIDIRYEKVP